MENNDLELKIIKTYENNIKDPNLINWYIIAKKFDFLDKIGIIPENGNLDFWKPYFSIDEIVTKAFKADWNKSIQFFKYLFDRYDFKYDINFEEYMNNELIFENKNENKLKLFISYSNEKKEETSKIVKFFKNAGFECFISNELKISAQYKAEILNEINEANIFILLLNEEFKRSDWCSQEAGMAYLKYKKAKSLVYCISTDNTNPYGFLNSFNGKQLNENCLWEILDDIDEKLGINSKKIFCIKKMDKLISDLENVNSYDNASSNLRKILKQSKYITQEQINSIMNIAINHDQIYNASSCEVPMKHFILKFPIDENLINEYCKVSGLKLSQKYYESKINIEF